MHSCIFRLKLDAQTQGVAQRLLDIQTYHVATAKTKYNQMKQKEREILDHKHRLRFNIAQNSIVVTSQKKIVVVASFNAVTAKHTQ